MFYQSLDPAAEEVATPGAAKFEDMNSLDDLPVVSVEKFWEMMDGEVIYMFKGEVELVLGVDFMNDAPNCDCNPPEKCRIVEDPSGDMYWTCNSRACKHVVQACPKPTADPSKLFDTGTEMALGAVLFDRYTTYAHVLKWMGRGFSYSTFAKLAQAKMDEFEWPAESYQLEPGEELDVFLSYRGTTGRMWLWATVLANESVPITFWTLMVGFPFVALLIYICGPEPLYYSSKFWLSTLSFDMYATKRSLFNFVWPNTRTYFIFIPYGSAILCFVLWFWSPVCTWFAKGSKVWFDKYCVHQSHKDTQSFGLVRVPAYLKASKKLVCVFDADYVEE